MVLVALGGCGGNQFYDGETLAAQERQKAKASQQRRVVKKPAQPVPKPKPEPPPPPKPCEANDECIARCDAGDAVSCTAIGQRYDTGKGVEKDAEKARAAFEKACEKKDPQGCYELALGWGDDQSRIANYTIACDANIPKACTNLGFRYGKGRGVSADLGRARELAEKACKLGDSMGCSNLGLYLRDGKGGPKDLDRAVTLSRKACDDGEGPACDRLAEMYDTGNGVTRDQALARTIYTRACDLKVGCNNLGVMYLRGEGGAIDVVKAKALFEQACELNDATGCLNLARIWRRGTVRGDVNLADAAELYDKACKAGNKEACDELMPTVNETKAKCAKKATDCNNWAYLNEHGIGVEKSMQAALKLFVKSCLARDRLACENAGNVHRYGKGGVKEDKKKALDFYVRGCKLDNDDACKKAKELRGK